ncbi:CPBP family intramembrane glutamic endopeptidase [Paenactinomyces guangxiensis]|uniref:CPBP family intramembrane metalloprotease n=1 Tax=Paenactinomyces guangxiensis TaxID=1490290 RepID=A0A7W1WU75_9BACL|nr:type II CAAX endopeptidase family protein [Paenactinomyces guangxiensis]MBA4496135.1 CPBP family intramembrane metalloprotease [Paenactinomyces guangxiensis]MBH8593223.1 CPBP family intramembrane metalloprotease [Paenactinomyces guangxiensis]
MKAISLARSYWLSSEPGPRRIDQIRNRIAWVCCICFFFMVPLEYASLQWLRTERGTWLILRAQEADSLTVVLSFVWSLLVLGTTVLFLITGCLSRFAYEKRSRNSRLHVLDLVYYTAWIQTLTMLVSIIFYLWPNGAESVWLTVIDPYLPHMWMLLASLVLFQHKLRDLGFGKTNTRFWLLVPVISVLVYGLVYFFLDRWVTEPVAHFFSLELSSWREESISQDVRVARETGWEASLCQLVMLGMIGPAAEEILFRGVLQQMITRCLGVATGIILSAALFALFHVDVALLGPLFILGLILSCFRVWFNSLWAPVLFHILNNSISVILEWVQV